MDWEEDIWMMYQIGTAPNTVQRQAGYGYGLPVTFPTPDKGNKRIRLLRVPFRELFFYPEVWLAINVRIKMPANFFLVLYKSRALSQLNGLSSYSNYCTGRR
jgi:hypothetical protein